MYPLTHWAILDCPQVWLISDAYEEVRKRLRIHSTLCTKLVMFLTGGCRLAAEVWNSIILRVLR